MNTLIILGCILVWVVSGIFTYDYIKTLYSKNGILENSNPDLNDIIVTCVPVLNTVVLILGYIFFYPKKNREKINARKFFNLDKKEIHCSHEVQMDDGTGNCYTCRRPLKH